MEVSNSDFYVRHATQGPLFHSQMVDFLTSRVKLPWVVSCLVNYRSSFRLLIHYTSDTNIKLPPPIVCCLGQGEKMEGGTHSSSFGSELASICGY